MSAVTDPRPAFLVLPSEGDLTIRRLQRKVHAIALRRLLRHPTADLAPASRRALNAARAHLSGLGQQHKAALMAAIGHPDVLPWLLVAELNLPEHPADDLVLRAVPPLLTCLAHLVPHRTFPETLLWDLPIPSLPDGLAGRHLRFGPPARGVVLDPMGLEICLADNTKVRLPTPPAPLADADGMTVTHPFHRLADDLPTLSLSLHDSNPLSMYEAHPDKDGNAISLGDKPLEVWQDRFREALDMIRLTLPSWYAELKSSLRRIVPVGYLPERHLSASYREAPGIAYLTLCDDPMTIAEAIIHETQHTKVNLLSWVDPVVHNAHTCWTSSPVRPDLRPLWGVLLAAHAFVPVSEMHRKLAALDHPCTRTPRFPRRRHEVLVANRRAMDGILDHAEASPAGRRLIDDMDALLRRLEAAAPPPPAGMDLDPNLLPPS